MKPADELSRLLAAERAETRSPAATERGLVDLRDALGAGVPPLPVAHGPLAGFGTTLAVKGAIVFAGLTAIGLTSLGLGLRAEPPDAAPAVAVAPKTIASQARRVAAPSAPLAPPPPTASVPTPRKASLADAATTAPPPSTFAEELRLMKSAKEHVDAGRDLAARAQLQAHARLYPQGVFRSEREALALLISCRTAPAEGGEAAQRYVSRNPGSPLVDRISRACRLGGSSPLPARSSSTPTVNFPDAERDK